MIYSPLFNMSTGFTYRHTHWKGQTRSAGDMETECPQEAALLLQNYTSAS
jgi:hypothetical protein